MTQLPLPDYLTTFLRRREAKALVLVSLTFVPQDPPRSLPERLLAMTRRANDEQLGGLRVKHIMEANINRLHRDVQHRNSRLLWQGDQIADLARQVRELQPVATLAAVESAYRRDEEESAYRRAEARYHPNVRQ